MGVGQSKYETETQQPSRPTDGATAVIAKSTPVLDSLPRRVHPLRWLMLGVAFGSAAVVSAFMGAALTLTAPLPKALAGSSSGQSFSVSDLWHQGFRYRITRPINILVMGIDRVLDAPPNSDAVFSGNSDTMLLVHLDPDQENVSVLSIPRDTQVMIPGAGMEKINYANVAGGPTLAAQTVSRTLNGVTIDRYVRVSTDAFREMVDLLGGVKVFVPEPMHYQDDTQHLYINLGQGWHTLNGAQAEQFARFRHDNYGDIGRVQRQQQLIRALRERLTDPTVVAKIPQAIQIFQKYIDTNLSTEEMLSLADYGLGLKQDNFRMVMLPGRFSRPEEYVASYWIMDPSGRDQVMREYFDVSSVAVMSQEQTPSSSLRIAIQNASGKPQVGQQLATYLKAQGYSNVYITDDWPDEEKQTQIIVQRGDLQSASSLETVLGVGKVVAASTGDLDSDLTIRVGEDWIKRPRI